MMAQQAWKHLLLRTHGSYTIGDSSVNLNKNFFWIATKTDTFI